MISAADLGSDCELGSGALPHGKLALSPPTPQWTSDFLDFGANVRAQLFAPLDCLRIGEARHPGPESLVHFGTSNPSGLRRKELHACELGVGVWSFSETQLSGVTQRSCTNQIKSIARQAQRDVRVLHGAPVQTRVNSSWAGTWSGVSVISDFACRPVSLPFHGDEFSSGRLLVSQHFISNVPVMLVSVYGFPKGPTWPDAHKLNERLLQVVTEEVIIGGNGVRIVTGDFNETATQGAHFPSWSRYGWQNAQTYAQENFGWTPQATSKGAREVDMLWLSPEALALFRHIEVRDVFSDHSTVVVGLEFEHVCSHYLSWPLPSAIPWDRVKDTWKPHGPVEFAMDDSTEWFKTWSRSFESSLDGHITGQPHLALTPQQRGRGSRTAPEKRLQAPPLSKPSREGELSLRSDLVGSTVRAWFKQLRRFQSLLHSMRAASISVNPKSAFLVNLVFG